MQRGFSAILILVGIVVLIAVAGGAFFLGRQTSTVQTNVLPPVSSQQAPVETINQVSPSPVAETANESKPVSPGNWKTYTNKDLGVTFEYPFDYQQMDEGSNAIAILSPLNKERGKGFSIQNGELKVEVFFKKTSADDTLAKFSNELKDMATGNGATISQDSNTSIDNVEARTWQTNGGGGGSNVYALLHKGNRITIVKYPPVTTRQAEFDQILSTFKFN